MRLNYTIATKRIVKPLNSHQPVRISQNVPSQYYGQGGDYPGVGQLTPFNPEVQNPYLPAVTPAASSNPLSKFNFNDVKGFIDRMGGIEGIMGTMTKVQKMVQTFQQMAPMLKVLMPKLGGTASLDDDDLDYYRSRRRRRRRSSSAGSRGRGRARRSSSRGRKRRRY